MINRVQLLRNIGLFESVSPSTAISLARLTLVYAENGRGKTTLAAILRSLATGDPIPIAERRRLAVQNPPHVILACDGGPPPAIFENNAWNRTLPEIVVFDDVFIDENVHSGLAVAAGHRQNLHELILGAPAVALNRRLGEHIARIEVHITALREKAAAIPAAERGALTVDEFCMLAERPEIDLEIQATERNLAATREQQPIRTTLVFDTLSLPSFDVEAINRILAEGLASVDVSALARVQAHLAGLGQGAEAWIAEGMRRLSNPSADAARSACPFCAQDLTGSQVINHYRAYFSAAYGELKRRISEALASTNRTHGNEAPVAFERAIRVAIERRQFWSRFVDLPEVSVDTATIVRDWQAAREGVEAAMKKKQAALLDPIELGENASTAIAAYEAHRSTISALSLSLQRSNGALHIVKEQAAASNQATILSDLSRLKAVKARYIPSTALLCDAYLSERTAKTATETLRDRTREELDNHRAAVFPGYQTAVNEHLQQFNAGFRLDGMNYANTRGGPTCTYNVVINNTPVAVGNEAGPGEPSFRNTLSAGDRNTLALGFFFASLDHDPAISSKVVVIDDPISSLDDHRSSTTIHAIRRLAGQAGQVIVLSHNKPFLCRIWEDADQTIRAALRVAKDGAGSIIQTWDVDQDCVTEHDRRHAMLRGYLAGNTANSRDVAEAIRPVLEAFLRVACPEHFPPGKLLGPFLNECNQRLGQSSEILSKSDVQELGELNEYAKKFHHTTNAVGETEHINDSELEGFVKRVLSFAKP